MDRNYFLSYSQIAFLLLISAVGKLNTRFVSVTISKSELLHYTDGNNAGLYLQSTIAFSHQLINSINAKDCVDSRYHYKVNNNDTFQNAILHRNTLENNHPVINHKDFFLSSVKNINFLSVQYKWREHHSYDHQKTKIIFEKVKSFNISFSLLDGFKCIVKIPDKLVTPFNIF